MINIILKKNIGGHYLKKPQGHYEKLFKAHEE